MERIAFYGGSFDPVHNGHIAIAKELINLFELDKFVFIPAFHAPHKKDRTPASGYDRYAMLAMATDGEKKIEVSKIELESPKKPYTVQTLQRLKREVEGRIFFVMGADSWQEITTWRSWEKVLTMVDIIVMTRPDYEIAFDHVTEKIRKRIVDLRNKHGNRSLAKLLESKKSIYLTNAVQMEISSTEIREMIRCKNPSWEKLVPENVARYIVKYQLYLK
ncbi:MAG: nicotinate (nicotinamide) nucleotide adenylyltransferase [Acidobacteria bacterium]|jgi:nicotinate-nucleotide adenylyltransferase|nr:MAG: nicotinate (nicotinamide) nucleotide adenylyltransferase [Acidobacteriota bacterium]GIU81059.1 MAG: putative nicotinate-nucleotide adenylyltransferase [Pyrinomonadaceae bacterium]